MFKMTVELFDKFATKQEELDRFIQQEKGIETDKWLEYLNINHVMALKNEVAEFHNECIDQWKYWKDKAVEPRKIISEGVDIIHFLHLLLNKYDSDTSSLVNYINKRIEKNEPLIVTTDEYWDAEKKKSIKVRDYRWIMNNMYQLRSLEDYLNCYAILLLVLNNYSFSLEEIETAYDLKNKENHDRQKRGY